MAELEADDVTQFLAAVHPEALLLTRYLLVVSPILAPGWVRRIATPRWPADLAAHMSPSATWC